MDKELEIKTLEDLLEKVREKIAEMSGGESELEPDLEPELEPDLEPDLGIANSELDKNLDKATDSYRGKPGMSIGDFFRGDKEKIPEYSPKTMRLSGGRGGDQSLSIDITKKKFRK